MPIRECLNALGKIEQLRFPSATGEKLKTDRDAPAVKANRQGDRWPAEIVYEAGQAAHPVE